MTKQLSIALKDLDFLNGNKGKMMTLSQENRNLVIETPLGPNRLILTQFAGSERLSSLFSYRLDMLSESNGIAPEEIIGQSVDITLKLHDGSFKYYNGLIGNFVQDDSPRADEQQERYAYYEATLVPWFFALKHTSNCRIFQNQSATDIVEQIFRDNGFLDYQMHLNNSCEPREYCAQYNESDFDFISRLLAEEGIYYYFTHEQSQHTMLIADSSDGFRAMPNMERVRFYPGDLDFVSEEMYISCLQKSGKPCTARYTVNDYNFEIPQTDLKHQVESVQNITHSGQEIYQYPAAFQTKSAGERIANLRIQQEEVHVRTVEGGSNCQPFSCGHRFELIEHPDEELNNRIFALTSLSFSIAEAALSSGEESANAAYFNSFSCIPIEIPYRPSHAFIKPKVSGIQTAFVVGPENEDIFTDKYGRVKIQFHWDRQGQRNENSSCWVRVGQLCAGAGWGAMFIPRIGQEVIVNFLEGDPDRPIVIGSLYNANNMPPYELPAEKTKSTIKTNSTPQASGYNEIRFEDKKDKENMFIHAQGSQDIIVRGTRRETVGGDRHLKVKGAAHEQVATDKHFIVQGSYLCSVGGNVNRRIEGDWSEGCVGNINLVSHESMSMGSNGDVLLKSNSKIVLRHNADNFITIDSTGITIKGSIIKLNSGGSCPDYQSSNGIPPSYAVEASAGHPVENESPTAPWPADVGVVESTVRSSSGISQSTSPIGGASESSDAAEIGRSQVETTSSDQPDEVSPPLTPVDPATGEPLESTSSGQPAEVRPPLTPVDPVTGEPLESTSPGQPAGVRPPLTPVDPATGEPLETVQGGSPSSRTISSNGTTQDHVPPQDDTDTE